MFGASAANVGERESGGAIPGTARHSVAEVTQGNWRYISAARRLVGEGYGIGIGVLRSAWYSMSRPGALVKLVVCRRLLRNAVALLGRQNKEMARHIGMLVCLSCAPE